MSSKVKYYTKDNDKKIYLLYLNKNNLIDDYNNKKIILDNFYLIKNEENKTTLFRFIGESSFKLNINYDFNFFYYNTTEKKFIFELSKDNKYKVFKEIEKENNNQSIDLKSLLSNINNDDNLSKKSKEEKNKKSKSNNTRFRHNKIRETSVDGRIKRDAILNIRINKDDSDLVRIIKEIINESFITKEFIYSKYTNENEAYNMYYGLISGHKMTYDRFLEWLSIFDLECEINIVAKNKNNKEVK